MISQLEESLYLVLLIVREFNMVAFTHEYNNTFIVFEVQLCMENWKWKCNVAQKIAEKMIFSTKKVAKHR